MVVDKYVGRCLDVGSTPTGSIIPLHSFAFLGKTLLNQRFFIFIFGIPLHSFAKKGVTNRPYFKKGYNICRILKIIFFRRKTWDSNPRTLLHAYRVSNTAS